MWGGVSMQNSGFFGEGRGGGYDANFGHGNISTEALVWMQFLALCRKILHRTPPPLSRRHVQKESRFLIYHLPVQLECIIPPFLPILEENYRKFGWTSCYSKLSSSFWSWEPKSSGSKWGILELQFCSTKGMQKVVEGVGTTFLDISLLNLDSLTEKQTLNSIRRDSGPI